MIVVDTNIVTYFILNTAESSLAASIRRKDNDWHAPILWRSEFRNILMGYIRNSKLDITKAKVAMRRANHIVQTKPVSSSRVIELAGASGCTAYDCEFVSLAERLQVPLVTNDKQVLKAFPAIAMSMSDFLVI